MIDDSPVVDPNLGRVVGGRYEIQSRLGEGGVGVVYRAVQQPIGREVALKLLLPDVLDERTIDRFLREAKIISRLRHPHTVNLYDFGRTEDGSPFIVMELLEGGSLAELMRESRIHQAPALHIMRQVCAALEEAHHAGVIHRDLKPENVLFDRVRGEDFVVRVVDFGMARLQAPTEPAVTVSGEWGALSPTLTLTPTLTMTSQNPKTPTSPLASSG